MIVHPGHDDAELRAALPDARPWGAAWRQRDLEAVLSPDFDAAIREAGAVRITWADLRALLS